MDATGGSEKEDKQQTSIFIHVIGDTALEVYMFKWHETGDIDGDDMQLKVMAKFDKYCTPKRNLTLETFHFNNCNQQTEEGIDAYLARLRKHSNTCKFDDLQDSLIKDRLVCGITDNVTRECLLWEADLTLEKAVKACKAAELVKTCSKELSAPAVHYVHKTTKTKQTRQTTGIGKPQAGRTRYTQSHSRPASNDTGQKTGGDKGTMSDKHQCRWCGMWHVPSIWPNMWALQGKEPLHKVLYD